MQKLIKRVALITGIAILFFALWYSGILKQISLENIKAKRHVLQAMVHDHYWSSVALYLALFITIVAFSLPFAALMSIVGGFLFGFVGGVVYTNIGITTGSIISFLVIRYVFGDSIQERYSTQLASFNRHMQEDGAWYLLAIHLIIGVPLFMINLLAALSSVSLSTFIWTTSLGTLFVSFAFTLAGKQLNIIESVGDIFSPTIIVILLLLALLAVLPILIKKTRLGGNNI